MGLVSALHGLCRGMSKKYKIEVHLIDCDVRLDMPKDLVLCLFRVAHESLGNVAKHSKAKGAKVSGGTNATCTWLRVSDVGRGFDLDVQNARAGIGLIGMREASVCREYAGGQVGTGARNRNFGGSTTVRKKGPRQNKDGGDIGS